MSLGFSKIGAASFEELLRLNPQKPTWIKRDRFVLSVSPIERTTNIIINKNCIQSLEKAEINDYLSLKYILILL